MNKKFITITISLHFNYHIDSHFLIKTLMVVFCILENTKKW